MNGRIVFVCGISVGLCLQLLNAQPPAKTDALTIAVLQKRIKAVQSAAELPAPIKDKVLQYLQDAVERLDIAQQAGEKAIQFEQRTRQVNGLLQTTEGRLKELPASAEPSVVDVETIEELERLVVAREKQIEDPESGLRKQVAELDAEAARRRVRPEEIMNELSEVEERLHEIDAEIEGLATSGEPREVQQAHQWFLIARRQRGESELRALEAESRFYQSPAAADLLQSQQELAVKTLTLKTAELALLQTELGRRRGSEADQRVHQAELVLAQTNSSIKPIAEENLALAKEHRDITNKLHELEHKHETTSTTLNELQKEFDRIQKIVDDVGLTDSIGLLLRQQRAKLMDPRVMRSNLSRRNDVVRECRMRLFQLDADRVALIDLDAAIVKRVAELDVYHDQKSVDSHVRDLLTEQRQLCKSLDAEYTKYFKQLIEMDIIEKRLLELTSRYANYVDERVLWIRTGQSINNETLTRAAPTLAWISDRKLWNSVLDATWQDADRRPMLWMLAAVLLTVWLGLLPFLSSVIQKNGVIAAEISCRDLQPTLRTVFASLGMACGWPLAIWFLSWRLDHTSSAVAFVHSVAAGLQRAATFALPLELLRVICVRGGLAERHFDWPPRLVIGWRRNLSWFLPVGMAAITLIGIIENTADEHRLDSSGRLTFLVFAALSAIFSLLTIRRVRIHATTHDGVVAEDTDMLSERFWKLAPKLAVTVCAGLFVLGWIGYFYTALQLTWRLQSTAWFALGLLVLRATIRRWIALERRRMVVLQDEELMSIAAAGREPGNQSQNAFLFPRWNWPDFRLNLKQIVNQMRSLLDTGFLTLAFIGMWFVWADVMPALNILDRFTLWQTTVEQAVTQNDPASGPSVIKVSRPIRVTAANLGVAMLIVAISIVAGRNIPGLVEVILLEHLSVDAGIRFAATCLVRYAIFLTGMSGAFAQIGIGWNNIQWLVAAASVGLGFGLQEIFCNFVSGIILLFERPMRVGDVVTIGETTGTVSRIRFRATTVVDGDRKELIVPNKEFITGKLLNWTLSDRVNRVGVKVVVDSQSDPQKVRRVLLDIADQQPELLKEPPPTVTLEDMNGGLTFMLRAFLPTLESRGTAIHDLHTEIHKRFRAEGIVMSTPTQELYVHLKDHQSHSSTPPPPHQSVSGIPIKPLPTDFSGNFRRA